VNLTTPNPVTNFSFSKSLAKTLQRPLFLPAVPTILIKSLLGEASDLVLDSLKVRPEVLLSNNFDFKYPGINMALENLLGNN
jgi:NAD dependent epimerase/dehydratase family enzyme